MKLFPLVVLFVISLPGCDSGDFFTPPRIGPESFPLSLESPVSRDTLVVGQPFMIKGNLDDEVDVLQINVLSGNSVLSTLILRNDAKQQPFEINEEVVINTSTGRESPIRVGIRFSWRGKGTFSQRYFYLKDE